MNSITGLLTAGALVALPALMQPLHAFPGHAAPAATTQEEVHVIEGPRSPLGEGTAVAWVAVDARGNPVSIGVNLTEDAIAGLPHRDVELNLELPAEAKLAGYDHVGLNWAPHGHMPAGVYDSPHFDVHFYRIGLAERERIVPEDPHYEAKLARAPAAGHVPPGFQQTGGVPRMGSHWVATDAPELAGRPFDRTLLLGTYDGQLVFVEPMITRAFLLTRPNVTAPIRAPERAAGSLSWPEAYSISFDGGAYRIALTGLRPVPRQ